MAGDLENYDRPRREANQRWDALDSEQFSLTYGTFMDALSKIFLAAPLATGGANPVGLILTGGALTANPTSGSDSKVRLPSAVFSALDANGRFMVKPSGTTIDLTLAHASNQVYAYIEEEAAEPASRRFSNVSSPFAEATRTVDTKYKGVVNLYARNGNATNVVASDVVNGRTVALVFLGIATVSSGAVTLSTTLTTNRLSSIDAPGSVPSSNITNGSARTLHDLIKVSLYKLGRSLWKNSLVLTPAASNNFGAYNEPSGHGLDVTSRFSFETITIGNGTSIYGLLDRSSYANDSALLTAAVNLASSAIPTIIRIKKGVTLDNFTSAVDIGVKTIIIEKEGAPEAGFFTPDLTIDENVTLFNMSSATGRLILRDLAISVTHATGAISNINAGGIEVRRCNIIQSGGTTQSLFSAVASANISKVWIEDTKFSIGSASENAAVGAVLDTTGCTDVENVVIKRCTFSTSSNSRSVLGLYNILRYVTIAECVFSSSVSSVVSNAPYFILCTRKAGLSRHQTGPIEIRGCLFVGAGSTTAIYGGISAVGYSSILSNVFFVCKIGVLFAGSGNYNEGYRVVGNIFNNAGATANELQSAALSISSVVGLGRSVIAQNLFEHAAAELVMDTTNAAAQVQSLIVESNLFVNCRSGTFHAMSLVGQSILNTEIKGNVFRETDKDGTAAKGLRVQIATSGASRSIERVSISYNVFEGQYVETSGDEYYALSVLGTFLKSVSVDHNRFSDINNITTDIAGTSASETPRVVEVCFNTARHLHIEDNRADLLVSSMIIGDSAPNNGCWLFLDSPDHSSVMGTVTNDVFVRRNTVGDDTSTMAFLFMPNRVRLQTLEVCDNKAAMDAAESVNYVHEMIAYGLSGAAVASAVTTQSFRIARNYFRLVAGVAAVANKFLDVIGTSGTTLFVSVQVIDNIFHAGLGTTHTGPVVEMDVCQCTGLRFAGNMYSHESDTSPAVEVVAQFDLNGSGVAVPSHPGSGVNWDDNVRITG